MFNYKNILLYIVLNIFAVTSMSPTYAYNTNWEKQNYTHFSNEEPLKEMLKAMASDQNIPIIISNRVTDTISVYFRKKKIKEILDNLKTAYNLITYFDGNTLYIYKSDEIQSATISLTKTPIVSLEKELIKIGAIDTSQKIIKWNIDKSNNNSASILGPKRFIDIVFREAKKLEESLDIVFYKWTTKDGRIHYGNKPPFGTRFKEVLTIQKPIITTPSSSKKSANINANKKMEIIQ